MRVTQSQALRTPGLIMPTFWQDPRVARVTCRSNPATLSVPLCILSLQDKLHQPSIVTRRVASVDFVAFLNHFRAAVH